MTVIIIMIIMVKLLSKEHGQSAQRCPWSLTYILLFHAHKDSVKQGLLVISPFHR